MDRTASGCRLLLRRAQMSGRDKDSLHQLSRTRSAPEAFDFFADDDEQEQVAAAPDFEQFKHRQVLQMKAASALSLVMPRQAVPLVHDALRRAGDNASELVAAIRSAPAQHRSAVCYLVAWMPQRDLSCLTADFLLEHVGVMMDAREQAVWGDQIPDAVFEDGECVEPYLSYPVTRCLCRRAAVLLCK